MIKQNKNKIIKFFYDPLQLEEALTPHRWKKKEEK